MTDNEYYLVRSRTDIIDDFFAVKNHSTHNIYHITVKPDYDFKLGEYVKVIPKCDYEMTLFSGISPLSFWMGYDDYGFCLVNGHNISRRQRENYLAMNEHTRTTFEDFLKIEETLNCL